MNEIYEDFIFFTYFFAIIFVPLLYVLIPIISDGIAKNRKNKNRINALKLAQPYLEPYTDLWKNQVLSNRILKAELRYMIIYLEGSGLSLKIKSNRKAYIDLIWDYILNKFSSTLSYDDICSQVREFVYFKGLPIEISETEVKLHIKLEDMVDVNNCSEYELTKLSGINIAVAKRIVAKREVIGGFKTKEEFLKFINLKPHQEKMIKKYVRIRRIKVVKPKRKSFERHVDL